MKFEIVVERHYAHDITDVWKALTTNEAISEWLLETRNFKAEAGHRFEMTCLDDNGDLEVYRCQVLEVNPPHRMVWSWVLASKDDQDLTEVVFNLTTTEKGTLVTLTHRGDRDQATIDRFKSGWSHKLDILAEILDRREVQ